VVCRVNKVDYEHLATDRATAVRSIVVPIGLGAAFLAVAVTVLGWWHPVLFDDGRTGPAWAIAVPVLFLLAGLLGLTQVDWRSANRSVLPALALGTLLVGFAEEVLTRGVLVVGGREQGWSPLTVFLMSTGLFAILHGLNAFFGLPWQGALVQIGVAFVGGTAFYVTRLSTGTLIAGILIHALWDFVTIGALATGSKAKPAVLATAFLSYVLGIVAIVVILVSG
jgi:membrane protease YdiL (CAAX protease family)